LAWGQLDEYCEEFAIEAERLHQVEEALEVVLYAFQGFVVGDEPGQLGAEDEVGAGMPEPAVDGAFAVGSG
jgi:hypothetical protein